MSVREHEKCFASLVCWFESQYRVERLRDDSERDQEVDILTRLERRTYTRHLARRILSLMTEEDMMVMVRVSRNWRVFLMKELRPQIFCKIRHLQIVESKMI